MPISQDRMLAVIKEGLRLRRYAESLRDEISGALRNARNGADAGMTLILIEGALAVNQLPNSDSILIEARHYQINARANSKRKEWARKKRREKGLSETNTAPSNLVKPEDPDELDILSNYQDFNKGSIE